MLKWINFLFGTLILISKKFLCVRCETLHDEQHTSSLSLAELYSQIIARVTAVFTMHLEIETYNTGVVLGNRVVELGGREMKSWPAAASVRIISRRQPESNKSMNRKIE